MAGLDYMNYKIAAAIRTEKDFSKALRSKVDMIFLLHTNIMTLPPSIREIHAVSKKAFVHVDFAEGLGKDKAGLQYLKKLGVDGICTTRTNLVRIAKDVGLVTVQRFFMVDSHSVGTSLESIRIAKPDIVELMPAIVTKKIKEFTSLVDVPLIAGGLVETEEEVRAALESGADVVSTGETELWSMDI
jgi:glycerol uptake operon antiterminator